MANRAERLVGVDRSREMLEVAHTASAESPNIVFSKGDFAATDLHEKFDLVLCTFDSLNYVRTLGELAQVFGGIERHLTNRGRFVFDVVNEKHFLRTSGTSGNSELLGVTYKFTNVYDPVSKESTSTFGFGADAERHRQIPIEYTDLTELLGACDLQLEHAYADLKGSPIGDESPRIYAVAKHSYP